MVSCTGSPSTERTRIIGEESCKEWKLQPELAEYIRRVMGSNDGVEDSTEFPQMPLVFAIFVWKTPVLQHCSAKDCVHRNVKRLRRRNED